MHRIIELDNGAFAIVKQVADVPPTFERAAVAVFYDRDEADRYANRMTIDQMRTQSKPVELPPVSNGSNGHDHGEKPIFPKQQAVLNTLQELAVDGVASIVASDLATASGVERASVYKALKGLKAKGAISYDDYSSFRLLSN